MNASPLAATAWPFIAGPADNPRQAIGLIWETGVSAGPPPAEIRVDGAPQQVEWVTESGGLMRTLQATVLVPLRETARTVSLAVPAGESRGSLDVTCTAEPPRHWELFLVNHSHVDIGYTEYPEILADAHGDYIARALDIMTLTDDRPDEERYRWTCEASWTVEQLLRRHPGRADEFVRRCREGRMELTALYANLTDLCDERMLERAVGYATDLRDRYGIDLVSACNYDVNGFGWALPRILKQAGVRYLDTAINETRALGVRPRPAALRWASPDGSDVLLWHSGNYLLGNRLMLHASRTRAAPQVAAYLLERQDDGYPHHAIEVLMSGQTGDSMPPSAAVCDVVADWNRAWLWPRLRLATTRQWFEHLEAAWPGEPTRYQKAWPDWWADGNGAALYEATLVRRTGARLAGLEGQRRALRDRGIGLERLDPEYEEAWRRALLFCEHTWGPYESALDPDSPASRGQWHSKATHVYAAAALADSIEVEQLVAAATAGRVSGREQGLTNATLQGAPSGYLASDDPAAVLVYNPLPAPRSDIVRVGVPGYFFNGHAPLLRDAASGAEVAALVHPYPREDVVNRRHVHVEFLAADLPAGGHKAFLIEDSGHDIMSPASDVVSAEPHPTRLENAAYRLEVDPATGALRGLVHKASGHELVRQGAGYLLNEAVYERVAAPGDRNAVASWDGIGDRNVRFERTSFAAARIEAGDEKVFARGLHVEARGPQGMRLVTEIVLHDHPDLADRVDIVNTLHKPIVGRGEALYHAFPLATPDGQIYLAVAGGVMRPGLDQVPGTATDWHGIQNWFAVAAAGYSVVVASPDVPLVQCTGINTGLWRQELPLSNGLVMSWTLNNYWFTNFPARQGGRITYRYSITLQQGAFDPERAARFGAAVRHPAWGRVVRLAPDAVEMPQRVE